MAKIHRTKHDLFRQFFGFGFDHQHAFMGPGNNQIQIALFHLFNRGVQHIGTVYPANTRRPNGAKKRNTRQGQGRRCANDGRNIGVIFHIMGKYRTNNLGFTFEPFGKQRTDRPINQP